MQPIEIVERVKSTYKNYIKTSFPVINDGLRQQMHSQIDQANLLWRGPFLSLQCPYQRGEQTLAQQQQTLGLHPKLLTAGAYIDDKGEQHLPFGQWRLYSHQQTALEQILADENTIISSGTGSGKTESFFLPILSHCLQNPGPGIKALILYPMNALANDQFARFAKYLAGTGVTFARYTGAAIAIQEEAAAEFLGRVLSDNALFRAIEEVLTQPCSLEEVTAFLQTGISPQAARRGERVTLANQQGLRADADETYLRREVEAYLLLGAKAKMKPSPRRQADGERAFINAAPGAIRNPTFLSFEAHRHKIPQVVVCDF